MWIAGYCVNVSFNQQPCRGVNIPLIVLTSSSSTSSMISPIISMAVNFRVCLFFGVQSHTFHVFSASFNLVFFLAILYPTIFRLFSLFFVTYTILSVSHTRLVYRINDSYDMICIIDTLIQHTIRMRYISYHRYIDPTYDTYAIYIVSFIQ